MPHLDLEWAILIRAGSDLDLVAADVPQNASNCNSGLFSKLAKRCVFGILARRDRALGDLDTCERVAKDEQLGSARPGSDDTRRGFVYHRSRYREIPSGSRVRGQPASLKSMPRRSNTL
jgi:hypothetical protein